MTTERETRGGLPCEVRASEDGKSISVAGYAAVFDQPADIGGSFREVIAKGAFTDALKRGDDVAFLINHDGLPLARTRSGTLKLKQDDHGLHMSTELDAEDPDVRAIVGKMKRGDVDKMSFAFTADVQEWDDTKDPPLRTVRNVRLYDVSVVTTPAYDGTEIALRGLAAHRKAETRSHALRRLRMKSKNLTARRAG